jgi:hypothetical protein
MKLSGFHKAVYILGMQAQYPERNSKLDSALLETNQPNGSAFNYESNRSLMPNSSIRSHG